jgi:hypothetical protein
LPVLLEMLASEQVGVSPESSVADTLRVTATIRLFGGTMVDGDAVTLLMTGGVVSRGFTGVSR